jgi:hypothetical protein
MIRRAIVMKTTNIKLNFIITGFSNFPVLCPSALRLPLSLSICNPQRFYGTYSPLNFSFRKKEKIK